MRYLSVCSGIEAATVAWKPLGWECVGLSEIEKFPSAVLQHHYPDLINHGDMCGHEKWPRTDVDVLVAGTPCQSFSVAGLRAGMADPRGNLALVYLAIAERWRPRWLVWENVPGVLSSDGGRDFGSLIGAMVKLGYGVSWTVLDAQYFGVPQRRRRVFVVGCLGDWQSAAKVLFEPESLRRNPPPSREAGQDVTHPLRSRPPGSGGVNETGDDGQLIHELAPTLPARTSGGGGLGGDAEVDGALIPVANTLHAKTGLSQPDFLNYVPEVVGALSDGAHCGGGLNGQDAYSGRIIPVVGALNAKGPGGLGAPEVDAGHYIPEVADPLVAKEGGTYTHEGSNNFRTRNVVAVRTAQTGANGIGVADDVAHTIDQAQGQAIAFAQNQREEVRLMDQAGALASEPGMKQQTYIFKPSHYTRGKDGAPSEVCPPLSADADKGDQDPIAFNLRGREEGSVPEVAEQASIRASSGGSTNTHVADMQVRRLTPTECERLQGFPDGYTKIPGGSDSGRYKALGNSMAVPVMAWIGRRIQEVDGGD